MARRYDEHGEELIATLTIPAADLLRTLASLPDGYEIIGSHRAELNTVILLVVSDDFSANPPPMTVEVTDAGSTRTVRVVPVRH